METQIGPHIVRVGCCVPASQQADFTHVAHESATRGKGGEREYASHMKYYLANRINLATTHWSKESFAVTAYVFPCYIAIRRVFTASRFPAPHCIDIR